MCRSLVKRFATEFESYEVLFLTWLDCITGIMRLIESAVLQSYIESIHFYANDFGHFSLGWSSDVEVLALSHYNLLISLLS